MYRAVYLCRKTLGSAGHNEHHEQVGTRQTKAGGTQRSFSSKLKGDAVLYHFLLMGFKTILLMKYIVIKPS